MDIEAKLVELAEEHLTRMGKVPWDDFAASIRRREPAKAGETFGCVIEGIYFDIGDNADWAGEKEGDIRLTTFATTGSKSVERAALLRKPR
jgi:hypothetical protein